jgi:hypothetical protein
MIMSRNLRQGRLHFVFCNDGRVVGEKESVGDEDEKEVEKLSGDKNSGLQLV